MFFEKVGEKEVIYFYYVWEGGGGGGGYLIQRIGGESYGRAQTKEG